MDPSDPSLPPPNEYIHRHFLQGLDSSGSPIKSKLEGIHASEERTANRELFSLELEFVQALASPFYLYNLAVEGYLDDPEFLNYLKYRWVDAEGTLKRYITSTCFSTRISLPSLSDPFSSGPTSETNFRRVKSRPPIADGADGADGAGPSNAAAQLPQAGDAAPGLSDQTAAQPGT